jgi:hypothetical protein
MDMRKCSREEGVRNRACGHGRGEGVDGCAQGTNRGERVSKQPRGWELHRNGESAKLGFGTWTESDGRTSYDGGRQGEFDRDNAGKGFREDSWQRRRRTK